LFITSDGASNDCADDDTGKASAAACVVDSTGTGEPSQPTRLVSVSVVADRPTGEETIGHSSIMMVRIDEQVVNATHEIILEKGACTTYRPCRS
jgi:hypothetical protein